MVTGSRFVDCGCEAIDTYADLKTTVSHGVLSGNHVAIMSVGSSITVVDNVFVANGRGIEVIENGTPTITRNEFRGQQGAGIYITHGSPSITHNNLTGNIFNLQRDGSARGVTAENNCWGSAELTAIEVSTWDGTDAPALGFVDFVPYASERFDLDVLEG